MGLTLGTAELSAVVGALTAVVSAVALMVHRVHPWMRKIGHLIDDFTGEPARDGLPDGRPGVMERLRRIEEAGHERSHRLDAVEAEIERLAGHPRRYW